MKNSIIGIVFIILSFIVLQKETFAEDNYPLNPTQKTTWIANTNVAVNNQSNDNKKIAPVSNKFKKYANKNLSRIHYVSADYYYSKDLDKNLIDKYATFFRYDVLSYVSDLFPQIKKHNEKPTFMKRVESI